MTNHTTAVRSRPALPARAAARAARVLGNPTRLRMLAILEHGPLCGCQLRSVVRLAASTVSEHLTELHRCGVLAEQKQGKWVHYRIDRQSPAWPVAEALLTLVRGDPDIRRDVAMTAVLRAVPVEEFCRSTAHENATPGRTGVENRRTDHAGTP